MKKVWEMLGIDSTSDIQKIKLAFAEKAKETHPEDNPEGFRMLRESYQMALEYARTGKMIVEERVFEDFDSEESNWINRTIKAKNDDSKYVQKTNINFLELDNIIIGKIRGEQFLEGGKLGVDLKLRANKNYWIQLYETGGFEGVVRNREKILRFLNLFLEEKNHIHVSKHSMQGLVQIKNRYEEDELIKSKVNELNQIQAKNIEYRKGMKKFFWLIGGMILFAFASLALWLFS